MILTDREWLRFMSFALVVGGVLGAVNTGALLVAGLPLHYALVGAIGFTGALALVIHAVIRYLLETAGEREVDSEPDSDTEEAAQA
jgi:hypothetical protein